MGCIAAEKGMEKNNLYQVDLFCPVFSKWILIFKGVLLGVKTFRYNGTCFPAVCL